MSVRTMLGAGAAVVAAVAAVTLAVTLTAAPAYDAKATEAWRVKREAELKAPNGWLTVAGLYFLRTGANSVGADPASDIVLPGGAAPAEAGVVRYDGTRVALEVKPGVAATGDGHAIAGRFEFLPGDAAAKRQPSQASIGGITLQVHRSGQRVAIRLRDPQSAILKHFTTLSWFPVDAAWNVPAKFVPYQTPKKLQTQNILGDISETVSPGEVELTVAGQTLRLVAYKAGDGLSFVFSDATAGTDTYRLRFLSAPAPGPDGRLAVDFNRAYNPPCAFNPYTTCPVPVPQNRLKVPVKAGEKSYAGAHGTTR